MVARSDLILFLQKRAYDLRRTCLEMTARAGSGHPTSCLSAADLIAALFFYGMHFDASDYNAATNDRFILSKGHAAPLLYAVWHQLGKVTQEELQTYRSFNSHLEGHPTARFAYAESATGSLGMGLSIGAGMALFAQRFAYHFKTFVLLGDSECAEGQVWEAIQLAAYYKLHNLVGIIDANRLGQSTQVMNDHHVSFFARQCEAFGWKSVVVDGHDMLALINAFDVARSETERPVMIVAKTIKGYGIESIENKQGFHGKSLSQQLPEHLAQLEQRCKVIVHAQLDYQWHEQIPYEIKDPINSCISSAFQHDRYELGARVATRHAYGQALVEAGRVCSAVVSLDAEVNNSTYAYLFAQAYPERFIQSFIAEQNMVSMAVGFARRGAVPFVSTFGAFFSRAFDQIRMAAIARSPLRLVGSHAGVSVGEDGPSQMALEDIALLRTVPGSIVLYPCDAVGTYAMTQLMLEYTQGISYMRTTRAETPVIYNAGTSFMIGGSHVLRSNPADQVCIIAAGITLHEALKAYDELLTKNIVVRIIDAYSIKPLDEQGIISNARACGTVITVEDHYNAGGLGEAISTLLAPHTISIKVLAVRDLPRSGKPEELLAWAGIDAQAIVRAVTDAVKNR